jgi:5-methylcytosine-specific restriction endonuclease McrA
MPRKPMDRARRGLNQLFAQYRYECYRRNNFWGLSHEEFGQLTSQPCHYCGKAPLQKCFGYLYSGLDRKDNAKGYHVRNVVPCCMKCNSIKGKHLTYEEMLATAEALAKLKTTQR